MSKGQKEQILSRADRGWDNQRIADDLGVSVVTVKMVRHNSSVGPSADVWKRDAIQGTTALLRALRRHHPERCAV